MKRTHNCGELRLGDAGAEVTLNGWVRKRRDHGGLIFIDMRDREGVTQVVIPAEAGPEVHETAERIRPEYVLAVKGTVRKRPEGTENPKMGTGEIEVLATAAEILNEARTPPFPIEDVIEVEEETRLRYRYLDLRRPKMLNALSVRHRVILSARRYLDRHGFIEVETPILSKSTPEGARDYLVPSRVQPGRFFALPQSPQLLKQLLMIGGIEKYFQIAKCFRDEDLRADRQPEFTQIDIEMSFIDEEDIYGLVEGLMAEMFRDGIGYEVKTPMPRLSYAEAMERYGTDKPDIRFGVELRDISRVAARSRFQPFRNALETGGVVKAISVPGWSALSRKQLDELVEFVKGRRGGGLSWVKVRDGKGASGVAKHFVDRDLDELLSLLSSRDGDLVLICAGENASVNDSLSALRNRAGADLGLARRGEFAFVWVVEFPLFSYNEEEGRYESEHHPFTGMRAEDIALLEKEPLKVRSLSYDLVLNGVEVGSGSVRIHSSSIQQKVFQLLKLSDAEIRQRFGFFIDALQYGTPPHAGIAPGLDRIVMIMLQEESIREVIAFPKTQRASCLMTGSPSTVSPGQLEELSIRIAE